MAFKDLSEKENKFYIQTSGYCGNAMYWWGKDSKGYVTDIRKAGKYTKEEAEGICERPRDLAWECDYIDNLLEGQKLIIDMQFVELEKIQEFSK